MGAFHEDEVWKALGVGKDLRPFALLPIGCASEVPRITARRPLSEMMFDTELDG